MVCSMVCRPPVGDGLLVRLGQAQIIVGDHVAVRARFGVDVTHVRRLDLGVIKLE